MLFAVLDCHILISYHPVGNGLEECFNGITMSILCQFTDTQFNYLRTGANIGSMS